MSKFRTCPNCGVNLDFGETCDCTRKAEAVVPEEKRSCENCGNTACANSVVAFFWDECVKSNFTKHWRAKQ